MSSTALVADSCPANECDTSHLDLSEGAFKDLTGGLVDPPRLINIYW
jgi:hypothetical protein